MMKAQPRIGQAVLLAAIVLLCAGCIKETRQGDAAKFTYELWVPLSVSGGGVAGLLIGGILWSLQNGYKWTLIVLGAIGVVAGPCMMFDYAEVKPDGFTIRTGIPLIASAEEVKFDDVQQVRQTKKVTRRRRGKSTNYYYEFDLKSGKTVPVNISGNELRQRARIRIDEQLHKRNIEVVDDFDF